MTRPKGIDLFGIRWRRYAAQLEHAATAAANKNLCAEVAKIASEAVASERKLSAAYGAEIAALHEKYRRQCAVLEELVGNYKRVMDANEEEMATLKATIRKLEDELGM